MDQFHALIEKNTLNQSSIGLKNNNSVNSLQNAEGQSSQSNAMDGVISTRHVMQNYF